MITVESLTRKYAGFTAVDNVSFTAQPGRVTGFLGPSATSFTDARRVFRAAVVYRDMSTHTATVPGATLTYDIHGDASSKGVPLILIGSPMDSTGFTTLQSYFPDRTTVTSTHSHLSRDTPATSGCSSRTNRPPEAPCPTVSTSTPCAPTWWPPTTRRGRGRPWPSSSRS